uniref:Secreted protein n=1 Tax=Haemonchus placei TaxID=6290 RepID=A0A0N4W712_HAEPC
LPETLAVVAVVDWLVVVSVASDVCYLPLSEPLLRFAEGWQLIRLAHPSSPLQLVVPLSPRSVPHYPSHLRCRPGCSHLRRTN